MAECQHCGRRFSPRIGEQFCSPAHAREFFSNAARSRDSRKADHKVGLMTARHRVMELLRLPAVEPAPPPPAPLFPSHYRPQPTRYPEPQGLPIALIPVERSNPLVIELPKAGSLSVLADLTALAAELAAQEQGSDDAQQAPQLPEPEPADPASCNRQLPIPGAFAWMPQPPPAAAPVPILEPVMFAARPAISSRRRTATTPVKMQRAAVTDLSFCLPLPVSAGARILKSQPLPVVSAQACLRPSRTVPDLEAGLRFDRIFSLEPFRRELASPILPTGQQEALTRSGQHRSGPVRWEFLHELPEDTHRSRPAATQPPKPQKPESQQNINRASVAPWLVPVRPIQPSFDGTLRPFDWAQLIARLADFEDESAAAKTSSHKTTTRMAAVARRKQERLRAIPVLGPMIHFWQTQGWPSRALALAIPVLGFIAIKPSLDGSLREPVVLAKEMPRPVSTVVRREPTREIAASRGIALPPAPAGLPMPNAPTLPPPSSSSEPSSPEPSSSPIPSAAEPSADPAAQNKLKRPDTKPGAQAKTPSPKLVPERGAAAGKTTGTMRVANVEPKLDKFDQILLSRAAVELADDFSFGLDSWESRSNAVQWTYDATGFVRPNGLALYRPSLNLTDYSMEFLAKIDNSAISWVVRAQDLNNYMVVKMVQRGGGPLPRYTVMHYPVINGREGTRIEHPLPLNLYKDTLFRIRMDIRGSNYAVLVQDSVVDSWSDERLPIGGVGFFTGLGEQARIRWVQVTYQNDFIGKLCAWLAPKPQLQ